MGKTKVLFRIRSLEMGGVNKVLIDILNHISKEKLDITVMVNLYQGELRADIPKDIHLIKIARGKEDFSKNKWIHKLQLAARRLKLTLLDQLPRLMRFYYKKDYDIEIAFGKSELNMVKNSPQKKSKKIAWVHWEFSHEAILNKSEQNIKTLQDFDQVIFCSANVRAQVKTLYGVTFPNSEIIPNVVHPEEVYEKSLEKIDFEKSADVVSFSSVGRIKNGKGYPLLFRVHQRLMQEGLQHRIIIIGNGDRYNDLRESAKHLGYDKSFLLLGNQNNPFPYIKNSDCFILPTQSEAYPLSVKEALVLGIPVLATDTGGVNEIVTDGYDGLLLQYNEDTIYQKMKMLITTPSLLQTLSNNAQKANSKFEIDAVYKKIEHIFTNNNTNG